MASQSLPIRCPACGATVVPPSAAPVTTWWRCAACGHPVPVVPARDPAPLFSWEVFPNLYPPAPPPDRPARGLRPVLLALLVAGTVALAALAAVAAGGGALAFSPGPFTVVGEVVIGHSNEFGAGGNGTPLSGATVVLTPETGPSQTETTGADGAFSFPGLPPGRVLLNVTASGYVPVSAVLFTSAAYASAGAPSDPLVLVMSPTSGGGSASELLYEAPFSDLESFVASCWSATILFALGGVVAGAGALAFARGRRPALSIAGGGSIVAAPLAVFFLDLNAAYPVLGPIAGATLVLGTVVVTMIAIGMAAEGRVLEPE